MKERTETHGENQNHRQHAAGGPGLVAILQKFNVSGMSAIEEKDRVAFLAKLDELDAGDKAGGEDA